MRSIRIFQNITISMHDVIELDEDASHKLITVLRMKKGDPLILFTGNGYEYSAVIDSIQRRAVVVKIMDRQAKDLRSSLQIHLGQVISKGEKMEFVIQKATELGVERITPLFSERSVVHLKHERLDKKVHQWQKIAIHASEQCGRTEVPIIETPLPITQWIQTVQGSAGTGLLLDPLASNSLANIKLGSPVALLIGPEGGLSPDEIAYAHKQKFIGIKLGPRILRTETAALAAICALQCQAGDMV